MCKSKLLNEPRFQGIERHTCSSDQRYLQQILKRGGGFEESKNERMRRAFISNLLIEFSRSPQTFDFCWKSSKSSKWIFYVVHYLFGKVELLTLQVEYFWLGNMLDSIAHQIWMDYVHVSHMPATKMHSMSNGSKYAAICMAIAAHRIKTLVEF